MRTELEHIKLIEKYLANQLSETEKAVFEGRLQVDRFFAQEVLFQKVLVQKLLEQELRKDLDRIYEKRYGKGKFNFWKKILGFGVLLLMCVFLVQDVHHQFDVSFMRTQTTEEKWQGFENLAALSENFQEQTKAYSTEKQVLDSPKNQLLIAEKMQMRSHLYIGEAKIDVLERVDYILEILERGKLPNPIRNWDSLTKGAYNPRRYINDGGANNYSPTLSLDGKTLYFIEGNNIKVSTCSKGVWSAPEIIPITGERPTDVFLTYDNKRLYFSQIPTGRKDWDIFYLERKTDSTWSDPIDVGFPLNTVQNNETNASLAPDGKTLYFVKRIGLLGGDFIYSAELDLENKHEIWKKPRKMPLPINEDYDLTPRIMPDGKTLIFGSARLHPNQSREDLFMVRKENGVWGKAKFLKQLCKGDRAELAFSIAIDKVFFYRNNLFRGISKYGQVLGNNAQFKYHYYGALHYIDFPLPQAPIMDSLTSQAFELQAFTFAFNKADLSVQARKDLDRLVLFLKENREIRIEIAAHTDNKGEKNYNMELSTRRAQEVRHYLEKQGIASDRLLARGYGEMQERVPNSSEANREKNRRVEFRIVRTQE